METYSAFFQRVTGFPPRDWQRELASREACTDRLLRIPTGFGKTAGVALAWLYHRVERRDLAWPTRLVLVLPMRVLVEQTRSAVAGWLDRAGVASEVGAHLLMGGADPGEFHLTPDRTAVLVGTQDMVLSRALMRGFAAGRGRWPIDFGLLHHDALWVLDEVQLMDVGLATTTQLAAFRHREASRALRPSVSWWMSATLQPRWLRTVDFADRVDDLAADAVAIPPAARSGGLFDVRKALAKRPDVGAPEEVAALVVEHARPGVLTLVIANTVARAKEIHRAVDDALCDGKGKTRARREGAPELRLVHSRFRGHERAGWKFLARADAPREGRIVIATQVVEAGVDVSSACLITDLAPWPSLVQRFGRCARYEGERGHIVVVGSAAAGIAGPYDERDLETADSALSGLAGEAGPAALERFEEELDDSTRTALYRYEPLHVLRRADLDDLFDTTADLSGGDVDPSRFIRSQEERDVTVLWRDVPEGSRELARDVEPLATRDEMVRVPLDDARSWLAKLERSFAFDYLKGAWSALGRRDIERLHAGSIVLVPAKAGGYSVETGFAPESKIPVRPVPAAPPSDLDRSAAAEDDDSLSEAQWQTISAHGAETGAAAVKIARALELSESIQRTLALAGRWHDVGKAHATFQSAISQSARGSAEAGARRDLAKAPRGAWVPNAYVNAGRPGFRHEVASTLALFELLRRAAPDHDGLVGPHREMLALLGEAADRSAPAVAADDPLARELVALSAGELDLIAWLVCTHHGKVRCTLASTPKDQELRPDEGRVHGVREGDRLPPCEIATADGVAAAPELALSLQLAALGISPVFGKSWSDRVRGLLAAHGPFALAYLELLLRAADVAASRGGAKS